MRCARCGNLLTDSDTDEPMDFGAFRGQMICADCWAAECDAAWAVVADGRNPDVG